MSSFNDLMIDHLPEPVPMERAENGRVEHRGDVVVRTVNGNLGAQRVAVPRDLARVNRGIQELAAMAGDDWSYSIPFKKRDRSTGRETVTYVEGPTIKCALDVARIYGNCVVDCPEIEDAGTAWIFHGRFLDIETGFQVQRPFRQRKEQNVGGYGGDGARAEDIVFQIGASKAMRNAVTNALPSLVSRARALAQKSIRSWIEKNRPKAVQRIRELLAESHIEAERVERHYAQKLEDLTVPEIAQVVTQLRAVEEGYARADELFPVPDEEERRPASVPANEGGGDGRPERMERIGADEEQEPTPEETDGEPSGDDPTDGPIHSVAQDVGFEAPDEDEDGEPAEVDPNDLAAADTLLGNIPKLRTAKALAGAEMSSRNLLQRLIEAGHPKAAELDRAFRERRRELEDIR